MTDWPSELSAIGSGERPRLYNWLNQLMRAAKAHSVGVASSPGQITSVTTHGTFSKQLTPPPQQSGQSLPIWE